MFLALGTGLLLGRSTGDGPADSAIAACLLLVAEPRRVQDARCSSVPARSCTPPASATWTGWAGSGVRMPVTALAFGVGALGAAALPVTARLHGRVGAAAVADPRRPARRTASSRSRCRWRSRWSPSPPGWRCSPSSRPTASPSWPAHARTGAADGPRGRALDACGWRCCSRRPRCSCSAWCPGLVATAAARAGGAQWRRLGRLGGDRPVRCRRPARPGRRCSLMAAAAGRFPCSLISLSAARRQATTPGRAGLGLRRSPGQPADAVHRHVVRRTAGPGLRRRAATRARHRGHPRRASPATSSSGCSSASSSTTSSRHGSTGRCSGSPTGSEWPRATCRTAASTATWATRSSRWSSSSWWWPCERRTQRSWPAAQVIAMVVALAAAGRVDAAGPRAPGRPASARVSCSRGATCASCSPRSPCRRTGRAGCPSAGPTVLIVSSLLVCALTPLLGTVTFTRVPDDLFVVVSVLLLGTVAVALIGLDAGTAFGGMGSSRHMTIAALVEPTVLVSVYALSIPVGSSVLSRIVEARLDDPASVVSPVSLLALLALADRGRRGDRQAARRQPVHPPRADDGPRGDGAGEFGSRPGLAGAGILAAARRTARPAQHAADAVGHRDRDVGRGIPPRGGCPGGQARGVEPCSWPLPRSSSPSCGSSAFPNCSPAPSCWPSSR